jgi:hypothetical protein
VNTSRLTTLSILHSIFPIIVLYNMQIKRILKKGHQIYLDLEMFIFSYQAILTFKSQFDPFLCQWLVTGQWFSLSTSVSSTKKTDCHDTTEILLKMALNTINQPTQLWIKVCFCPLIWYDSQSGHFHWVMNLFLLLLSNNKQTFN